MCVSAGAETDIRTILVVDDEALILELTVRMLRDRGYAVLQSTSGARAVELCASYPTAVHLVVTDVTMPGVSGTDLAEQLLRSNRDLKVLYISGNPDPGAGDRGHRTSFLRKPFTNGQLVAAVRALLDGECPLPPGTVTLSNIAQPVSASIA